MVLINQWSCRKEGKSKYVSVCNEECWVNRKKYKRKMFTTTKLAAIIEKSYNPGPFVQWGIVSADDTFLVLISIFWTAIISSMLVVSWSMGSCCWDFRCWEFRCWEFRCWDFRCCLTGGCMSWNRRRPNWTLCCCSVKLCHSTRPWSFWFENLEKVKQSFE